MQLQGEWTPYTETICSVDPSGRGSDETAAAYISQKNGFLYLHEMRAYRDGYTDSTLLDILRGCKRFNVTKLVIETNFGDGIVSELFRKHLSSRKHMLTSKKYGPTYVKKIVSLILLNLSLISTDWWLIGRL